MGFKTTRSFSAGIWFNLIVFVIQMFFLATPPTVYADNQKIPSSSSSLLALKGAQILPSEGLTIEFYFEHRDVPFDQGGVDRAARIFLSGLAFDAKDLWVNLSPYEEDRVMSPLLAVTELGEILVQQDYVLKKRAALLTHPDTRQGQVFWSQLANPSQNKTSGKSAHALTKVWIVPQFADVYNLGDAAVLGDMRLKVLVEKDYLAQAHEGEVSTESDQNDVNVTRDVICPLLEKEVNESDDFAPLRQVFQALILAHWFKTYHADRITALDYVQAAKIKGIDLIDYQEIDGIYNRYYQLYKTGAYSLIREDVLGDELVPRKYFAGGVMFDPSRIRFIDSGWDWIKQKFGKVRLDVATLAFAALLASPFSVSAAQDITPPFNSVSVMELSAQVSGSTKSVMGYMTDFQQSGRVIKSPLPDQVKISLAPQDVGKLDAKLVKEITAQSRGFAKPRVGGGTYSTILDRGAVWVQHQDGTQSSINTSTIKTYVPQVGDIMVLQNRTPIQKPSVAALGAPPPSEKLDKTPDSATAAGTFDNSPIAPLVTAQEAGADDAWDKYLGSPDKKTLSAAKVSSADQSYSLSVTSEVGYMSGLRGGAIGEADIQVGKKNAPAGEFSLYGGLRLSVMPKYTLMQSNDEMMAPGVEKKIEKSISPYIGFHKPGNDFDLYFELQDFKNAHFGIESRPVYDQGWNYTYGLSGLIYDSVKGYRAGMMTDGYLSFKLGKIFPGDSELLQKTYLSSTLKVLFSSEGTRLGVGTKLTYNDRWQLFAEVSPFKDLPMIRDAMGHHYDLYKTRMGVAFRMSQNLEIFGQWVEPIGHANEKNRNFMFGWRWSFDRPVVNHNPRKQPVDYLEDSIRRSGVPTGNPPPELPGSLSPKVVGPASSALIAPLSVNDNVDQQRRGLLKAMTAGVLTAGLNPGALALGSDFFQALYKVDPNDFPVCGEARVNLSDNDPLTINHAIYLSFMYWYLTDKTNERVVFDDPMKKELLSMSAWQWDSFLKERKVTPRHRALVRLVQKKMLADFKAAGILPLLESRKDVFAVDQQLFSKIFRDWLDRWVIKLERLPNQEVRAEIYVDLTTGDIPAVEKDKRNQIKAFLNNFVTADDVALAMKSKGAATSSDITNFLQSRYEAFFKANPQWIVLAAQMKLNAKGYAIPLDGQLNSRMIEAIRKEVEFNPAKASSSLTPGGIDFGNLPQVTAWLDVTKESSRPKVKDLRKDVVGMTFSVLDITTAAEFDFVKR